MNFMRMNNCPECKKEISTNSRFCISCGNKNEFKGSIYINGSGFDFELFRFLVILSLLGFVIGFFIFLSNTYLGFGVLFFSIFLFAIGSILLTLRNLL